MKILGNVVCKRSKEGKWHHYSLSCETLECIQAFMDSLTCVRVSDCKGGDCECPVTL